jgi:uncharacterized protein YukE
MVSGAAQKISSTPPSGGKSSPAPQNAYGSSYQAPAANVYQPSYLAPQQGMGGGKSSGLGVGGYGAAPAFQQQMMQPQFNPYQQQQFNPYQQQFGGFQQQQGVSGLQGLYNNMMGQQQQMRQPMQRQPMQQYQDPALQYRPNMQNAQSALSRVRPSVQRQNQDAQAARIAELEAQLAGYNTPSGE